MKMKNIVKGFGDKFSVKKVGKILVFLMMIFGFVLVFSSPVSADCFGGGNYTDLYLNSFDVPEDFYDHFYISFNNTNSSVFFNNSQSNITGIKILPPEMLNSSEDYVPIDHYSVYLYPNGSAEAFFCRPGVYAIKVERTNPAYDKIYFVFSNASQLSRKKAEDSPFVEIETSKADIVIVEKPAPKYDGACDDAADAYDDVNNNVKRVKTVDEAIQHIKDEFNKEGRKVDVVIDGHGTSGIQSVGDGSNGAGTENLGDKNDKVRKFCKELKGTVKSLKLMGCKVGKDEKFLQKLSNCLGAEVSAYDKVMYSQSGVYIPLTGWKIWSAKLGKDEGAEEKTKKPKEGEGNCDPKTQKCVPACSDGKDNDGDGLVDNADPDCDPVAILICADGFDNDGDGLVDLDDPGCNVLAPPEEVSAITPLSFLLALLSLFGLAAIAMRRMYRR